MIQHYLGTGSAFFESVRGGGGGAGLEDAAPTLEEEEVKGGRGDALGGTGETLGEEDSSK